MVKAKAVLQDTNVFLTGLDNWSYIVHYILNILVGEDRPEKQHNFVGKPAKMMHINILKK